MADTRECDQLRKSSIYAPEVMAFGTTLDLKINFGHLSPPPSPVTLVLQINICCMNLAGTWKRIEAGRASINAAY